MTTFTHSSGQHLSVDDAEIYFEIIGNPIRSPLLLLHGGLGNLTDFNGIVGQLANEFRLIGVDFRGHGKSMLGKSRLTYQRYQADVEAILAHLNIDCFSILGFSDGGITALRMAAETPARIKGLVAVAAQSQMEADAPILPMLSGVTADFWETKFPDAVSYYRENNPEPDFDALIKSVVSLWTNIKHSAYPGNLIKQITAQTLLVRGDEDHLCSLKCIADLRDQIKGSAFLNIPYAGHEVYKDSPVLFMEVVYDFLINQLSRKAD
ncbi:alpha/beta fold hydrolase [Janthinobacterium sp. PAMC25594]|uniref:alpha/beta fold hydrolase n=1 Tax=Janthinobacterium sp. PAMC25594 TaxID=2861284 RepID=UPI001C62B189|nr:alpha/beta hydrolase [Janthinobacterium sp. PAMC25594]QYG08871.1 alpha/beta hydrolase [Janthinobacterium sp. PAMC25594]